MTGSEVYTYADWRIALGREEDFVAAWKTFVTWSAEQGARAEAGFLLQDPSDPQRFFSFGPWESEEALGEFFSAAGVEEKSAGMRDLAERFEPRVLSLRAEWRR